MARTFKIENGDVVKYQRNTDTYEFVSGNEKLKQDIKMILTTSVRNSTGLGCGLDEIIGKDTTAAISGFMLFPAVFDFQTRIRTGLNRLKTAQKQYLYGQRTRDELIYDFSEARIWPSQDDKRSFFWNVDILTVDGRTGFSINGRANN